MSSKKNKKEYTFEILCNEFDSIQKSKKRDIKKIADIFGRVQDVKEIIRIQHWRDWSN